MKYRQIPLEQKANGYIKQVLVSGHSLARLLASKNIETGLIETCLPDDAEMENLYDFEISIIPTSSSYSYIEGGKNYSFSEVRTCYSCAIDTIKNHLRANPLNLCVFDANLLEPTDKHIKKIGGLS